MDYFELKELPNKPHFKCERLRATLSVESCASMWRGGNQENIERLQRCKACPVGALHAGEQAASMSPLLGTTTCARCHRGATRLIGKHLCISCYNRQREQQVGKNAKGVAPTKLLPLCRRRLRYVVDGEVRSYVLDQSKDMTELVVALLRDSKKRVTFAFHGMPTGIRQGSLF